MGISVEIGSVVGSVASSLPAPAIDIGGHLGGSLGQGMDFLGSRMGLVNISPVINEGPAGLSGLENTMPIIQVLQPNINIMEETKFDSLLGGPSMPLKPAVPDLGGVFFNPQPELNPADVVAEAEIIAAPVFKPLGVVELVQGEVYPEQKIIKGPAYWSADEPKVVKPAELVMPQVEPEVIPTPNIIEFPRPKAVVSPALESSTQAVSSAAIQTELKDEETEEIVEQAVKQQREEADSNEIEDTEIFKIKIVESVKISQERRYEIITAFEKAIELGITVKEALSKRFWELVSPLAQKIRRKDWTIDLTANELNINPVNFSNIKQAKEASVRSVDNNIPVEEGKDSRQATIGEVRKVTHGEDDKLNSRIPAVVVKTRIVKKKVAVSETGERWAVIENTGETTQENTLEDLNLEGIFQKAA